MTYNILFISHERKMGGANHSLVELVKGMQNLGNHVFVLVLYRGCPVDKRLREMGVETFPCFFGWWQQPKDWSVIKKLLFKLLHWLQWISIIKISTYVRKQQINIIHSNSSVIDIGAQVADKTGCKHVWHFREYGESDYYLEYMYGKTKSMDYAAKHSDMIIFISNALYESYKEYIKDEKKRIIYDGIVANETSYALAALTKSNRKEKKCVFSFLVTGNISRGKNQKLVVEAVNILNNRMNIDKNKFQVYFAGSVTSLAESKKYMKGIQEYIKEHHLDNLIFMGYVEDMPKLRACVEAEIVPSKCEAYGRVTLEAMLNHNLVIASNSGANLELVGANENGILFEKDNPSDLAMKMLKAMEENNKEYVDRAYKYVRKMHTQKEAYQKVQDSYQYIMRKE